MPNARVLALPTYYCSCWVRSKLSAVIRQSDHEIGVSCACIDVFFCTEYLEARTLLRPTTFNVTAVSS